MASVTRQAGLRLLTWLVFVFSVARGFELVLLVLVARDRLGLQASGVGILSAAIGVGAIGMVPFVGEIASLRRPAAAVVAALLLTSVPIALMAVISSPVVACLALVLVGVGVVIFEVLSVTLVQRLSRLDLLGRVFGLQNVAVNGGKLVGLWLAPALVSLFSLEGALVAAVVVVMATAVGAIPGLHRLSRVATARRLELAPQMGVLGSLALFRGASGPALERVAASVAIVQVPEGTAVVRQDDVPDDLYVIRTGTFDVVRNGVHVATLNSDQWFGEIGLLRDTPRTATVAARTDAEVWRISGAEFLAAINESSAPPTAMLDEMSSRLAQLAQLEDPADRS